MGKASRRKKTAGAIHDTPVPVGATGRSPLRWPVVFVILAACALLIYSNSFSVPFQFDDEGNITENAHIRDGDYYLTTRSTRSFGYLTFVMNYHLGGFDVFGYHLINFLIHVANGFLVYVFVGLLLRAGFKPAPTDNGRDESRPYGQFVAFATALIFIAHPIQTQAVTYIVQRFASLVTLFYLLACVCYLKWRMASVPVGAKDFSPLQWAWYIAALLSTLIAMKTKENSFTIPFVIVLMEGMFFVGAYCNTPLQIAPPRKWARRAVPLLPFFAALAIIPLSLSWGEAGFASDTKDFTHLEYLFTQFRVLITYLRLLFFPVNQNLDYDYPTYASFWQAPVLISFLVLAGIFILAVFLWRRGVSIFERAGLEPAPAGQTQGSAPTDSPDTRHTIMGGFQTRPYGTTSTAYAKLIAFGIFFSFITISIESSLIPIKDVIFEHRLYLPSVGFCLAVVSAGVWFVTRRGAANASGTGVLQYAPTIILACAVAALGTATFKRNRIWQDKITLWQDTVKKSPNKPRPYYNLGLAYQDKEMLGEALRSYQETIRIKPDYADAHNNLGNVYEKSGDLDKAAEAYQQAFTVRPLHAESRNNLGNIYVGQGRLEEAVELYKKALELDPDYGEACNNLGIAYTKMGRLDEAVDIFLKGLEIKQDLDRIHYNLGNTYAKQGKFNEAIEAYRSAIALKPDNPHYHFAMGNVFTDDGRLEEAVPAYEATVRLKPDFAVAHFALGNAYAGLKHLAEAIRSYEAALKFKPDFAEAHNNLGNILTLQGDFNGAAREYESALQIKPDYPDAIRNLNYARGKLGQLP